MGWWGTGIMEGDTPWDVASTVAERLGITEDSDVRPAMNLPDHWSDTERAFLRAEIAAYGVDTLRERVLDVWDNDLDALIIANQVFGLLLISCGAEMPDDIRTGVLFACEADHWAATDTRRRNSIALFRAAVENYKPGTPVTLPQTGLLARLTADQSVGSHHMQLTKGDVFRSLAKLPDNAVLLVIEHDPPGDFDNQGLPIVSAAVEPGDPTAPGNLGVGYLAVVSPPSSLNWRPNPPGNNTLPDAKVGAQFLIAIASRKTIFDPTFTLTADYEWWYAIIRATETGWFNHDAWSLADAAYYVPCAELSPGDPNATP